MANAPTTALGRINSTASTPLSLGTDYDTKYGTYLKLFSGELFKGFQHNTIARDLVMKRTLKNGKSLQFIYTGRLSSSYHQPGTPILGQENSMPVAEKTIVMDDLLVSSAFVYNLDETLAHYELRGEISKKIGYSLAETYDRNIFRAITRGARKASPISASGKVEPGGTTLQVGSGSGAAADALDAAKLVTAFYDGAAILDEKGVSSQGRVAVLSPRQYYALIQQTGDSGLVNRDVQGSSLQSGQGIVEIAGIKIYKSMNIPFQGKFGTSSTIDNAGSFVGQTIGAGTGTHTATYARSSSTITVTLNGHGFVVGDSVVFTATAGGGTTGTYTIATVADANTFTITDSASGTVSGGTACTVRNPGVNNDYGLGGDFSTSCGLIFQKEAAGVVEAIGPQVQVTSGDVSVIYQGDVILGRLAMGADYLNPACAVELHTTNSAPTAF
jgi:hypothetical protein